MTGKTLRITAIIAAIGLVGVGLAGGGLAVVLDLPASAASTR